MKIMERESTECRRSTPWGVSQYQTNYGPGIDFYSTSSHGGFKLSLGRLKQLEAVHGQVKTCCGHPQWFEEDCDWAYVATAFPQYFDAEEIANAQKSLAYWKEQRAEQVA